MNHVLALALAAVLPGDLLAQEATPKPAKKTMTFVPGAATPSVPLTPRPQTVKPLEKPAATPTPKPVVKVEKPPATPIPKPAKPLAPAVVTSTVPPEPAQIVRAFFALLGEGEIDEAYAGLMKGSKIAERPEEVRTLKAKTKEAIDVFGVMHGYDLVDNKPVGERLMRATYLSLGHELPLRWRFYFYKAEDEWKLIDLRVDDKLTGIFDEATEDAPRGGDSRP
jgi:hypothetical protein